MGVQKKKVIATFPLCEEAEYKVYKTTDYNSFKLLGGNRAISKNRVENLKSKIQEIGYLQNPIIVNENFQIIDGQGRYVACKELKLPIYYTIENGIGLKECQVLNRNQENWKLKDFIDSYASTKNINYIMLQNLIWKYPEFSVWVILGAFPSRFSLRLRQTADDESELIEGRLILLTKEEQQAIASLNTLRRYMTIFKRIKGRKREFCFCIMFALYKCYADDKRLYTTLDNASKNGLIAPVPDGHHEIFLKVIQDLYNYRLSDENKIYFVHEYEILK